MNRASVLLLATAFALGGGLWWFFSRTSASGETRALPPTPSPVAARAESPSVGASVARAERESVPAPATPAVADATPHVPIPDPNKPFDLVDKIDWYRDQLRIARVSGTIDDQIANCHLLWGISVAAMLDERGQFTEQQQGQQPLQRPRSGERAISVNMRTYIVNDAEFPDFAAFDDFLNARNRDAGKEAAERNKAILEGRTPNPPVRPEIPEELFADLSHRCDQAREIGLKRRR